MSGNAGDPNPGTATFSDGHVVNINNSGSPYTLSNYNLFYVYFVDNEEAASVNLTITDSAANIKGTDKVVIAVAKRNEISAESWCKIVVINNGTPEMMWIGTFGAN